MLNLKDGTNTKSRSVKGEVPFPEPRKLHYLETWKIINQSKRLLPQQSFGIYLGKSTNPRDCGESRSPRCLVVWVAAPMLTFRFLAVAFLNRTQSFLNTTTNFACVIRGVRTALTSTVKDWGMSSRRSKQVTWYNLHALFFAFHGIVLNRLRNKKSLSTES